MVYDVSIEVVPLFGSNVSSFPEMYFTFDCKTVCFFSVSNTGAIFRYDRYGRFIIIGSVLSVDTEYIYYKDMFFEESRIPLSKVYCCEGVKDAVDRIFK